MKSRKGFVSNSSSSSFIVKNIDFFNKDRKLLTDAEINLLKNYGFKATRISHASRLNEVYCDEDTWKMGDDIEDPVEERNFGLWVACNEDEVKAFLMRNGIPFIASCHYGHETVIYQRGSDSYVSINNPGRAAETYGWDESYEELERNYASTPIFSKYSVAELIHEMSEINEAYEKMDDIEAWQEESSSASSEDETSSEAHICPSCKNEIDLEVCHCGIERENHTAYLGHTFVPMGCVCGYHNKGEENES